MHLLRVFVLPQLSGLTRQNYAIGSHQEKS
ncbi:MAG: hypothetical protein JWM01_1105 [Arthrobacter sp.]|jgi:hypothetical protein|nr:hypothetical protein [Arthrobacter sp.]MCU1540158.1 hypothetical protein [Arthrobacter sp.]